MMSTTCWSPAISCDIVIDAEAFIGAAKARGYDLFTGVPCSYLTPFINYVIGADGLDYVGATNEGDAVAIAAGAELGGRRSVVMMQNSGLGNAVSPLSSLTHIFNIPLLLIVTWRGQPGGAGDEPQHGLMGPITGRQLELLQVPWEPFPRTSEAVAGVFDRADAQRRKTGRPYALLMSKGSVAPYPLAQNETNRPAPRTAIPTVATPADATRHELLAAVQATSGARDVIIATTGFTGRALYGLEDRPNQLYMVGSMGCVSSLALGLALARPDVRVIALDGDGAALMRLGALATIGAARPNNLVHILFDNGMHESTGGQATVSHTVDFCAVAAACGYATTQRVTTPHVLANRLGEQGPGPHFVHLPTRPGVPAGLPRPTVTPAAVAQRLRRHLATV